MKEKFKKLPGALQRQIMLRTGVGIVFLVIFVSMLAIYSDLYLSVSCLAISFCFLAGGILLFLRASAERYVVIEGICTEVEKTPIRRRIKAIYVKAEEHMVKVVMKQRRNTIAVGDALTIYVADNTPVYESDNCQMLCSYLALERKKEGNHEGTGAA